MAGATVRQTAVKISIAGMDATAALSPYLEGFEHEDVAGTEEDRCGDTITIRLANIDWRFLRDWHVDRGTEIKASIIQSGRNTSGESLTLDCGTFYVDKIDFTGPPNL